jgi:hypothetical protein
MAQAYLIGLKDGNQSERYGTICQTDQGVGSGWGRNDTRRPISAVPTEPLWNLGLESLDWQGVHVVQNRLPFNWYDCSSPPQYRLAS